MNTTDKYAFWNKLRRSHVSIQYRYQRLLNHVTGKLLTGFEIVDGEVNLTFE